MASRPLKHLGTTQGSGDISPWLASFTCLDVWGTSLRVQESPHALCSSNTQDFLKWLPSKELSACISSKMLQQDQRSECKIVSNRDGTSLISHLGPIPGDQTKKSNYSTRTEFFHTWDLEISYSFEGLSILQTVTSSMSQSVQQFWAVKGDQ